MTMENLESIADNAFLTERLVLVNTNPQTSSVGFDNEWDLPAFNSFNQCLTDMEAVWFADIEVLLSIGYTMKQVELLCPKPLGNFYPNWKENREKVKDLCNNFDLMQLEKERELAGRVKAHRVSRKDKKLENEHIEFVLEDYENETSNKLFREYTFDASCHPMSKKPFYDFKNNISPVCKGELLRLKELFQFTCNGKFDIIVLRDSFIQFNQFMFRRQWFSKAERTQYTENQIVNRLVMCIFYDLVPMYLCKPRHKDKHETARSRSLAKFIENYELCARIFGGERMNNSLLLRRCKQANDPVVYSKITHSEWKENPRKMKALEEEDYEDVPFRVVVERYRDRFPAKPKRSFRSKNELRQPREEKRVDDDIQGEMYYRANPPAHFDELFQRYNDWVTINAIANNMKKDSFLMHPAGLEMWEKMYNEWMEYCAKYREAMDLDLENGKPSRKEFFSHYDRMCRMATVGAIADHHLDHYWENLDKAYLKAFSTWRKWRDNNIEAQMFKASDFVEVRPSFESLNPRPHPLSTSIGAAVLGVDHQTVSNVADTVGWEVRKTLYESTPQLTKDIFGSLSTLFAESIQSAFKNIPETLGKLLSSVTDLFESDTVTQFVNFLKDCYNSFKEKVTQVWVSLSGDNSKDENVVPHIITFLLIGIVIAIFLKIFNLSVYLVKMAFNRLIELVLGMKYAIDASWGFDYLIKSLAFDGLWDGTSFEGYDCTKSVHIRGEMFGLGMSSLVGIVAMILAILDPKGLTSANGVMNLLNRGVPFGEEMKTQLTEAIDDLWIRLTGNMNDGKGLGHLFESRAEVKNYVDFIRDMQAFAQIPNIRELCLKDRVKTAELEDLVRRGDAIKVVLKDNSSPLLGSFSQTFTFLRQLHNECLANADMYQSRIETVCCWFYGLPGQGKTRSLDLLPMDVYKDLQEALRDKEGKSELHDWTPGQRYTRVKGSDYWDGYYGQWCVAFPEIMTANNPDEVRKELTEILGICEDNVLSLNVAFTDKGKVFMRSDLLTITTNMDFMAVCAQKPGETGIKNNGAVVRRRTFPFKVVKKETLKEDYSNINETWEFILELPPQDVYRDEFFMGVSRFLGVSRPDGLKPQGKYYNDFMREGFRSYTYQEVKTAIGLEILYRRTRPKDSDVFQQHRVPVDLKALLADTALVCDKRSVLDVKTLARVNHMLSCAISDREISLAKAVLDFEYKKATGRLKDEVSPIDVQSLSTGETISLGESLIPDSDPSELHIEGEMFASLFRHLSDDQSDALSASAIAAERKKRADAKLAKEKEEKELTEEQKKKVQEKYMAEERQHRDDMAKLHRAVELKRTIYPKGEPLWMGMRTSLSDLGYGKPKEYTPSFSSYAPVSVVEDEFVEQIIAQVASHNCRFLAGEENFPVSLAEAFYRLQCEGRERVDVLFASASASSEGIFNYLDRFLMTSDFSFVRSLKRCLRKTRTQKFKDYDLHDRVKFFRKWLKHAGITVDLTDTEHMFGRQDVRSIQKNCLLEKGYCPSVVSVMLRMFFQHKCGVRSYIFGHGALTDILNRDDSELFDNPKNVRSGMYSIARALVEAFDPELGDMINSKTSMVEFDKVTTMKEKWEYRFLESIDFLKEKMMDFPIFGYCLIGSVVVGIMTTVIWGTFQDAAELSGNEDYVGSVDSEMMRSPSFSCESLTKRDPTVAPKYKVGSPTKKNPDVAPRYTVHNKGNPEKVHRDVIGEHFELTGSDAIVQANARVTACIRNTQEVLFHYPGEMPSRSLLFCLEGGTYMQTAHWFAAHGTAFTKIDFVGIGGAVTASYSNADVKLVSLNDFEKCDLPNARTCFEFGQRDAFLMFFRKAAARKSLFKNLPTHKTKFPTSGVTKVKPVIDKNITHVFMPYTKDLEMIVNRPNPIVSHFSDGKKIGFTHCGAVFGCKGAPGDCTLPYVDIYLRNTHEWLLGCHVGSGGTHGYFAPMYKEDIQWIWNWDKNVYVERSGIVIEDDETYECQAYFDPIDVYYPANADELYTFRGSVLPGASDGCELDGDPLKLDKSLLPKHMNVDNVVGSNFFGTSERNNFIPHETQFVPSVFQGTDLGDVVPAEHFLSNKGLDIQKPIFPIRSAPAHLTTFLSTDKDGKDILISPLKLSQDKIGASDKTNPIPEWVRYLSINEPEFLADGFLPKLAHRPKFVKQTVWEACFGLAGLFSSIDVSTAAGFWLWINLMTRKDVVDKDRVNPDGTKGWISPKLLMEIKRIELAVRRGKVPKLCTLGCLKDELRDLERVNKGKTRLFHVGDFAHMIWTKMVIGHAVEWIKANRFDTVGAIGTNPHGPDWAHWLRILTTADEELLFGGGDFSGYDTSVKQFFGEALGNLLNTLYMYPKGSFLHRELIYCCISTVGPLMVIGRNAYWMDYMNPSGGWATGFLNTFVNSCLMKIIFLVLVKECKETGCACGFKDERDNFRKVVREILYGDDNIWSVYAKYKHHWNMQNISRVLRDMFGMIYTRPDKKEVGTQGFIPLEEIDFLCRRFDGGPDFCKAPLAKDSIEGMLLWVRNQGDGTVSCPENIAQLEQNIDVALMEMYYYGRPAFDEFAERVQIYCRGYNVKYTGQSFEAYRLRHISSYQ